MKKWTYLLAAGLLAGATPVFTGCIDNDEPEGITLLRGAKADLLRAKAAVAEAEIIIKKAQAEYLSAQARHEAAKAAYKEAEAAWMELQNELKKAQNEEEKEKIKIRIEKAKQEMEEATAQHEYNMINWQKNLAEAQRSYELVLKQIEIAKAVCSDKDKVTIAELEKEVKNKYAAIYGGQLYQIKDGVLKPVTGENGKISKNDALANILTKWNEKLYNARLDKMQGLDQDVDIDEDNNNEHDKIEDYWIPTLKLAVEHANAAWEAEKKALTTLQEFLEKDVETADWRAEIAKLEEAIDELDKQISQKGEELKKAQQSESYIAAWQKVYGVYDASDNDNPQVGESDVDESKLEQAVQDGTKQVLKKAEQALVNKKKETELTLKASEEIEINEALQEILWETPSDRKEVFSYDEQTYKYYNSSSNEALAEDETPSDLTTIKEDLEKWVELVSEASADANAGANAGLETAEKKKAMDAAKKNFEDAVAQWEIALDAKKGTAASVPMDDLKAFAKQYNELYDVVSAKIDAYNAEYDKVYTKAYNDGITAETKKQEATARKAALSSADFSKMVGFDAFEKDNAIAEWTVLQDKDKTQSKLSTIVLENCTSFTTTEGTIAKEVIAQNAMAIINAYIEGEVTKAKPAIEAAAKTAANEGVEAAKKSGKSLDKAYKAMSEASRTVVTFLTKETEEDPSTKVFDAAIDAYEELAASPYGQTVKAEPAGGYLNALIGTLKDDVYVSNEEYFFVQDAKNEGKYLLANNKIEDKELTEFLATELDATTAEEAWKTTSLAAFGFNDRILALDLEKDEAKLKEGDQGSKANLYYTAKKAYETNLDQVNAKDDLEKLKAAVVKMQEDFEAELAANYKEAFSAEEAAVTEAQKADEEALAELKKAEEPFAAIEVEIAKLQTSKKAQTAVKDKLAELVMNHLGIEWPVAPDASTPGVIEPSTYDPESFEAALTAAVQLQEKRVAAAEKKCKEAEANLKKAEEGEYDAVAYYTMLVEQAQNDLNIANEEYLKAVENLKIAMEIMADKAE